MGWLTHWDDLIHGTVVFGAAVPLGVALMVGWVLPGRLWIALAAGLIGPVLWIFGWPSWPPGSDSAVILGLIGAACAVAVETGRNWQWRERPVSRIVVCAQIRAILWVGLGWLLYPAWLAAEGGLARRLLIVGAMGFSISAWAALTEVLARESKGETGGAFRLTPATWVPPSIALAVLLEFGGSARFAQCAGALAAATGGVCLLLIWGRGQAGLRPLAALWGMLFALLAWSGWLFAQIHAGSALALLFCPLVARAARRLPLPRHNGFLEQFWDAIAAAALPALVIAVGLDQI